MNFKSIILSTLAIAGLALSAYAQDIEGGIMLGTTEYQGDLTKKQITLGQTKPGFGILGRYYFGPRLDVKGSINYGWIEGTDKDYTDLKDRQRRDLSFKSSVLEFSGQVELNILPFISNSKRYRFAPYVFAGAGLFHFNPKATDPLTGSTVALQPLQTEGESKYSLWQFSIPYGVGIKYSLGHFWNIGLEVGQRKIFTDYLDDVSANYPKIAGVGISQWNNNQSIRLGDPGYIKSQQAAKGLNDTNFTNGAGRGNKSKEDMYVFAGITLTKTLRRFSCTNF